MLFCLHFVYILISKSPKRHNLSTQCLQIMCTNIVKYAHIEIIRKTSQSLKI